MPAVPVPIASLILVLKDGTRVPIRDLMVLVDTAAIAEPTQTPLVLEETGDEHVARLVETERRRKEGLGSKP